MHASQLLHDRLFPGYASTVVPMVIAIGVLVLIALMAGMFARTPLGRSLFIKLEGAVLARLPIS